MEDFIIEDIQPEPTEFEKIMANITKIQDEWLNYYDEEGNLCNKDGNIIKAAAPIEDDYTDLSYLYDDVVESPTNDIEPKVEEVIEDKPKVASLPY